MWGVEENNIRHIKHDQNAGLIWKIMYFKDEWK
jgi:hypothetical protein